MDIASSKRTVRYLDTKIAVILYLCIILLWIYIKYHSIKYYKYIHIFAHDLKICRIHSTRGRCTFYIILFFCKICHWYWCGVQLQWTLPAFFSQFLMRQTVRESNVEGLAINSARFPRWDFAPAQNWKCAFLWRCHDCYGCGCWHFLTGSRPRRPSQLL